MGDLASRDYLLKKIDEMPRYWKYEKAISYIRDIIKLCPAVDAVEVVHGEWIRGVIRNGMMPHRCSVCKIDCYVPTVVGKPQYKFCPNCGADMRERKGDDDR